MSIPRSSKVLGENEDLIQPWQQQLQQKAYCSPANNLASHGSLGMYAAVHERLKAALSEPFAPFTAMQLQAGTTKLQAPGTFDEKLLKMLAIYFQEGRFYRALQHYLYPLKSSRVVSIPRTLGRLHTQWNTEFCGNALSALKQRINREEGSANKNFYAKTIPIIQSSGTGKSRLVDELGKEFLSISFVFRLNGESGYPPGDPEIAKFMKKDATTSLRHSLAVSLLAGALFEVNKWFINMQENLRPEGENIAKEWHDRMAPLHANQGLSEDGQMSDIIASTRSDERKHFCAGTVTYADKVLQELTLDKDWGSLFNKVIVEYETMKDHPLVVKYLLNPAAELLGHLQEKRPVLFVFDEAAYLFENDGDDTLYSALRRVLRLLKDYPIWAFFLSTQSHVQYFAHADSKDSSARIRDGSLERVESFYSLRMDIEMGRRLKDKTLRKAEMSKPLSQFATADHMTMYGRPLWLIYRNSPETLRNMALCKLFNIDEYSEYNPNNTHHVFAALASRVSLDPCTNTNECIRLAREAVNSHLRLVVRIDQGSGRMTTTTPSEPIVAEAIASQLQKTQHGGFNWTQSIRTLSEKLLRPGLIEKGVKGELYTRLVFILARDLLQEKANLKCEFPYAMPFKVVDFLRSLFNSKHHVTLEEAVAQAGEMSQRPTRKRKSAQMREGRSAQTTLGTAFENAYLNFTHFTHTDKDLEPSNMQLLLHNLMHAQAALQFSFRQPVWDLLIPIYFGNPERPFEPSRLSAMLIQVKNRRKREKFSLFATDYRSHFPENFPRPVLSILLELGTKETPVVQSVGSFSPNVYGFYVTGAGSETFGCLAQDEGRLESACSTLLDEPLSDVCDIHNQICDINVRFRYHTFDERFPEEVEVATEATTPAETKGGEHITMHPELRRTI